MKQANVLFVTLEGGGNVAPVLGLARRLIGRRHSVTILSEPCLEPLITEMGAAFVPFGAHFTRTDRKADLFQDWNASKVNNPVFERVMLGPAPTVIDRCIEVIQARSIDLLFTDVLLFPGIIAAEYTGIPSVIVSHMPEFLPGPNRPPGNMGLKPGRGLLYRLRDKVFAKLMNAKFDEYKVMLNDKRARLGLPPLLHTLDLFHQADLRLIQTIEAFDTPLSPRPRNVRYTGPELDDPDWAAAETQASLWPDENEQPLVVVSFSSTFQNQAGAIQNCIDALSGLPVRGCVTLGPAMEDEGFRAANNVHLLKSVPHSCLFPQADLVITHGGHGTIMRALANGLPLICMPMGRDQDDNAVKVAMKGCGLKVSPKASPARIRKAVQQVLGNGQYATAAKGLQEAICKQSGPEEAIAEVDALMAARQGAVGKTALTIFRGIYSAIMIKAIIPALICLTILASCFKPNGILMPTASTLEIDTDDSRDSILIKAAHIVPTPNQYAALQNKFIAFIHFGPNTFTRMEWGTGMEDPQIFDLQNLDTDQWCAAMKAAGMKRVIFTAKHHDGFCLWQTRYTTHGIRSSPFQNGKGDVMRALSESCRKYGLELGVYLSPADLYQIEHPEGLYGNLSEATTRVIPRPVPERPFRDTTTFTFKVDDYNEYFLNQLFELLTEYGPIHEVWLDGAHPKRKGGQQYDYLAWKQLIQQLAPEAVVFGRQDVRWCGNEAGKTRDTEWNIIPYQKDPRRMNHFSDLTAKTLGESAQLLEARYLHYQMAETNTSIREGWFYRDDTHQRVRSADDVYDMYERSVGGNSIFLLNIPPNREGRFSDEDVAVLKEVGKRIQETYGENLLAGAKGPAEVLDDDPATFQLLTKGDSAIILEASEPITTNRFRIQEAIATHSERVEAHTLYAWQNEEWQRIAKATNIGYQRILRFPEVTAQRFKLVVSAWRLPPAIATVSAHYYRPRPPQLVISRDRTGRVHIQPEQHEFGWKPHGEDVAANLNRGYAIRYTTDGTAPGENALEYTSPFVYPSGVVKARAVTAGEQGSVAAAVFGLLKTDWTVLRADGEETGYEAALAFDGDPSTSWCPEPSLEPHYLAIDLGREHTLTGFAYTPPTDNSLSKLEGGQVETSLDGKYFMPGSAFRFGNLINDPTQRTHYFEQPMKAQYLMLNVHQAAGGGRAACIAEIDILTE